MATNSSTSSSDFALLWAWARIVGRRLLPLLCVLALGEIAARGYYYTMLGDPRYLTAPFGLEREFPFKVGHSWVRYDPCSRRDVLIQTNRLGTRGPDWPTTKVAGAVRAVVAGDSSTFGPNSPLEATWPRLLQERLVADGEPLVEVLNAGHPGQRIERINAKIPQWINAARPDIVIFYGGYTNRIPYEIGRFHETRGRLLLSLYYTSMLYTYVVEKAHLYGATWEASFLREMGLFRPELERLVTILRARGVVPIFVLQLTNPLAERPMDEAALDDAGAVIDYVRGVARGTRSLAAAETNVLAEVVRWTGTRMDVPVIDATPAFRVADRAGLFCSDIHLSDEGNRLLADTVARSLHPVLRRARSVSR